MSRRGNLDQRQEEGVAGLDRFALLLLAGQPCQKQLVMDPDQRVHLRRLVMIRPTPSRCGETTPPDAAARETIRQRANPAASTAPSP